MSRPAPQQASWFDSQNRVETNRKQAEAARNPAPQQPPRPSFNQQISDETNRQRAARNPAQRDFPWSGLDHQNSVDSNQPPPPPQQSSCDSSNYTEYAHLYNTKNGSCRTNGSGAINTSSANYNDADYACFAYYTLQNARAQLDPKIAELHNPPNSVRNGTESNFDATMLSGVLWAMLGTTAIYYAFTQL
jgi:hypothetical protein